MATKPAKKKPNKQHAVKGSALTQAALALRAEAKLNPPATPFDAVMMVADMFEIHGRRVSHLR